MKRLWKVPLLSIAILPLLASCAIIFPQHPKYANPNTDTYVIHVQQDNFGFCYTSSQLHTRLNNPGPTDDVYSLTINQYFNCGTNTFQIIGISDGKSTIIEQRDLQDFDRMGFILFSQYNMYQIVRNGTVIATISKQ